MSKQLRDTQVVGASFFVSILDVLINLVVAIVTGSTVMLAQMLQGLSDLTTAGLLYYGVKQSKRGRDNQYNFGYGREVYFWVMISALFMFFGTGLLSVYFGYQQFISPEPISNTWLAIFVLIIVLSTNGYAFSLSFRRLLGSFNLKALANFKKLASSPMIETKTTFIVDLLGASSAVLGLIALTFVTITGNVSIDGLGSMTIGLLMMVGAILLFADVKSLIVGRSLPDDQVELIIQNITSLGKVNEVLDFRSMYIGSTKLLLVVEVHLDDDLDTDQIEVISDEIKLVAKRNLPHSAVVQVEVETPEQELATRKS